MGKLSWTGLLPPREVEALTDPTVSRTTGDCQRLDREKMKQVLHILCIRYIECSLAWTKVNISVNRELFLLHVLHHSYFAPLIDAD